MVLCSSAPSQTQRRHRASLLIVNPSPELLATKPHTCGPVGLAALPQELLPCSQLERVATCASSQREPLWYWGQALPCFPCLLNRVPKAIGCAGLVWAWLRRSA